MEAAGRRPQALTRPSDGGFVLRLQGMPISVRESRPRPIADNEYDNLFVVVPATGTMTRIRY